MINAFRRQFDSRFRRPALIATAVLLIGVPLAVVLVDRWIYESLALRLNTPSPVDHDLYRRTHLLWDVLRLFPNVIGVAVAAAAITLLRPAGWRCAAVLLIVVAMVALTSWALQQSIGRLRPNQNESPMAFAPFLWGWTHRVPAGFPSGEAATSFAFALLLSEWFPRGTVWFYGLAGLVAASRVAFGMHYLSDVLAGGALAVLMVGPLATVAEGWLRQGEGRPPK